MGLFSRTSPEAAFWKWFLSVEAELSAAAENPLAPMHQVLKSRLERVHKSLTFEFGPLESGVRELAISADGDRAAFFAVERVVDAKPPLPRWNILRFRARVAEYAELRLQMQGRTIGADDIDFQLLQCTDKKTGERSLGVRIFIEGCPAPHDPEFVHIAFLLLDSALGEYDMETKVGGMEVLPRAGAPEDRCPFSDLVAFFDQAFDELMSENR